MLRITGIRARIPSYMRINRRPMKPAAKKPIRISTATMMTTPSPGSAKGR
jgi:hypothetical protein